MKYNDEDIIKSLNRSLSDITPNIYKKIENSLNEEKKMNKKSKLGWLFGTFATAVAVFMVTFGFIFYRNNYKIDSLISIDVNPSIELEISKTKKVVKANPLNEGGVKILDNMDLKGVSLDIAVNALTGTMVKYGFLTGDDANVLITVQNSNLTTNEEIKKLVTTTIEDSLQGYEVTATVMNQTIKNDKINDVEQFSKANNISYGKALFITNLIKKDASLNASELATMSIREISALITTKNIDITDLVEKDDDDSTTEKIEDTIEDINEEKNIINNTDTSALISKERAKEIALKHAGVSVSNVTVILDIENGVKVYEIEFKTNNKKYEYEINATTGKVLNYDTEVIKVSSSKPTTYIGESRAKTIAFGHADVSASEATMVKAVLDTDNGVKVYEIDFKVGRYEYEYEINATTGKIMNFDKEIDD